MSEQNKEPTIQYPILMHDALLVEKLQQQLEMRGLSDGREIIHQALRYYAHAYMMHTKGYTPAFVKDIQGGEKHLIGVRVEPFIPADAHLGELEHRLLDDDDSSQSN